MINRFNKIEAQYSNHRLIIPYAAPYFAYVAIANIFDNIAPQWNYLLRIVGVTILLLWAHRWYVPFCGPLNTKVSILYGILFGLVGCFFWIVLLTPFVEPDISGWTAIAFMTRLIASTLLVPIFEELVMRAFVFRLALQWYELRKTKQSALEEVLHNRSINSVKPGEWNYFAVFISTVIFALGHQVIEWPAAFLYGILMASLWIIRKDVISCVVAHGSTNFALGVYIYMTHNWGLW